MRTALLILAIVAACGGAMLHPISQPQRPVMVTLSTATLVENTTQGIVSIPSGYGGGNIAPGDRIIIGDSVANVQAAFALSSPRGLRFTAVTPGQSGQRSGAQPLLVSGINIGNGSSGMLVDINGSNNQLSIDSPCGTAWEFKTNTDFLFDLDPIIGAASNCQLGSNGILLIRIGRHTILPAGTDLEIELTKGNTSSGNVQINALRQSYFGLGVAISTPFQLRGGTVTVNVGTIESGVSNPSGGTVLEGSNTAFTITNTYNSLASLDEGQVPTRLRCRCDMYNAGSSAPILCKETNALGSASFGGSAMGAESFACYNLQGSATACGSLSYQCDFAF